MKKNKSNVLHIHSSVLLIDWIRQLGSIPDGTPPCTLFFFLFLSSLSVIITQLEIAAKQAGTIYIWSIRPKGGGYDDAGREEVVGKARGPNSARAVVGSRSEEQRS